MKVCAVCPFVETACILCRGHCNRINPLYANIIYSGGYVLAFLTSTGRNGRASYKLLSTLLYPRHQRDIGPRVAPWIDSIKLNTKRTVSKMLDMSHRNVRVHFVSA